MNDPQPATLCQIESHLWESANILHGKSAVLDYMNYTLSLISDQQIYNQNSNR